MARPTIYTPEERKERLKASQRKYRRSIGIQPRVKKPPISLEEKRAKNREYKRKWRERVKLEERADLEKRAKLTEQERYGFHE